MPFKPTYPPTPHTFLFFPKPSGYGMQQGAFGGQSVRPDEPDFQVLVDDSVDGMDLDAMLANMDAGQNEMVPV